MKQSFEKVLEATKVMVLDGAMATELEAIGCDLNDKLWSAKVLAAQPELIKKVHMDYFQAGADCGISSSYQATIPGFMEKGYSQDEAEALIKKSVQLLCEARDEWWQQQGEDTERVYPIVSASVGPYGAFLADGSEYRGEYTIGKEELKEFHKRRMELLWNAEPDILAIETVPCLEEAMALAELVEEMQGECWISFSCKNETEISEGTKIAECAKVLDEFSCVKAIGINCTAPEYVASLIHEICKVTDKPVIVYPNSGEIYDPVTKNWGEARDGKTYQEFAREWIESGAKIVGGCCRTTPENIREICQLVR